MTEADIAKVAETVRMAGVPDCLNRWIEMTPEKLAACEAAKAKIGEGCMAKTPPGPKEQALRAQRAHDASTADAKAEAPSGSDPDQEEESAVRTKKQRKSGAARKAVKGKTTAKKPDRSPLAVGQFIVAGGEKGVTMAAMEAKFAMEAHPLRSKIHDAKHKLGFAIDYDHETKRYTGKAPRKAVA